MGVVVTAGASVDASLSFADPGAVVSRTLVLNFDPIIESEGARRLHLVMGWNDPRPLTDGYASDLAHCSANFAHFVLIEWIDIDEFPLKIDGFRYDDGSYLSVARGLATGHSPDLADYDRIIADWGVVARVDAGDVDEVILWGGPWFGYYESRMAGPGAYWVNSPGMPAVPSARKFVLMGLNYERAFGEAIHSFGHRVESIMTRVYGSWNAAAPAHNWDFFSAYDAVLPGNAGCGDVHFPPNGTSDYDYANPGVVASRCDDYLLHWPTLTGATAPVSRTTWGTTGDFQRDFLRWWHAHLPRQPGINPDGRQNHWWKYVADFNGYPESS